MHIEWNKESKPSNKEFECFDKGDWGQDKEEKIVKNLARYKFQRVNDKK